jgi:hypothetical protein
VLPELALPLDPELPLEPEPPFDPELPLDPEPPFDPELPLEPELVLDPNPLLPLLLPLDEPVLLPPVEEPPLLPPAPPSASTSVCVAPPHARTPSKAATADDPSILRSFMRPLSIRVLRSERPFRWHAHGASWGGVRQAWPVEGGSRQGRTLPTGGVGTFTVTRFPGGHGARMISPPQGASRWARKKLSSACCADGGALTRA